jgi:hypothetical protein
LRIVLRHSVDHSRNGIFCVRLHCRFRAGRQRAMMA